MAAFAGACLTALSVGAGIYLLSAPPVSPVMAVETVSNEEKTLFGWSEDADGRLYLDEEGDPAEGLMILSEADGENVYYFENGRPQTGFVHTEAGTRYFDSDGVMAEGLFEADGKWYFAGENGILAHGFADTPEGREYFSADGSRASGLTVAEGKFALLDEKGRPVTGWETAFDGIYYRDGNGVALTGEQMIDGVPYSFNSFGRLQTGFVRTDEGTRYYSSDGTMAVGTVNISGAEYTFTEDGLMIGKVLLPVPVVIQNPELPNGCEITSLAEVLQYLGFDVEHTLLAKEYLPCEAIRYEDGKTLVPDPEEAYVGNPATTSGWYCFEEPVIRAADQYLSDQGSVLRAQKVSGADLDALSEYLQNGQPVIVWITQKLADVRRTAFTWTLPDGSETHPYGGLHCVVLSGMDENTVTFSDPIYGEWTAEKERFYEIYQGMGSRAVVIG